MHDTTMAEEFESRMTRGAVAGLVAGLFFLLANMAFFASALLPSEAPSRATTTSVPATQ